MKKIQEIELSISYTTRPIRKAEKNGKDYFFVSNKKFIDLKKNNFFIETEKVFGHFYGSPYINIKHKLKKGETIASVLKYYKIDQKHINLISQQINNLKITKKLIANLIIDLVIEQNISKI